MAVILTFEFTADGDRWRVRVLETGFSRDAPNVVTLDSRGLVSSIGDHPHVNGADAARTVPIYDRSAFDPHRVASCVWYFTKVAHQGVRQGIAHFFDLFDRYDLIFELPGYEGIAADLRRKFEKDLYEMVFVGSYSINGRRRKLPWNLFRFH
jgi:hypothetical protein